MKYTGESQIAKEANYTLSLIPILEVIDRELPTGNSPTLNRSDYGEDFIDWANTVPQVLPKHLRYIADFKKTALDQLRHHRVKAELHRSWRGK